MTARIIRITSITYFRKTIISFFLLFFSKFPNYYQLPKNKYFHFFFILFFKSQNYQNTTITYNTGRSFSKGGGQERQQLQELPKLPELPDSPLLPISKN